MLVRKDQFKKGDLGIFIEVDSKVPEIKEFDFLASKHYKIKTQKFCKGTVLSQGLLMGFEDLPEYFNLNVDGWLYMKNGNPTKGKETIDYLVQEGDCLTDFLGIKYSVAEDNRRKANINKYTGMVQRHQNLFKKNPIIKWLYKRKWGKELLFIFLGKKNDSKTAFPTQFAFIHKTDEERVENLVPDILSDKREWIQTLKIDGTSSTYILERKKSLFKPKYEFYVTSRNVRQLTPDQANWHSKDGDNVYWEMAFKYNIENVLKDMLEQHPDWQYVCIQGETCGIGVQGNPHKLPDTRLYVFNLIDSVKGRWNSFEAMKELTKYNIPFVPIINLSYILPDTLEELKAQADGKVDIKDGEGLREGFVYRSKDGITSFKNVSNQYLLEKGE